MTNKLVVDSFLVDVQSCSATPTRVVNANGITGTIWSRVRNIDSTREYTINITDLLCHTGKCLDQAGGFVEFLSKNFANGH